MELQQNFEDEQTPSRDFVQGYNNCELLHSLAPLVLKEISPISSPDSDYFNGFFAAKAQIRESALEQASLDAMASLREKSHERDDDLERE